MKISLITDEFTQDLEEAVSFALENGLQGMELRSVDNRAVHDFSLEEVSVWRGKLQKAGLKVSCLSSSFYKCDMDADLIETELAKLEKLCRIAGALDCDKIRGFAFFRRDGGVSGQQLAPFFSAAEKILRRYGKTLVLEADPSVNTTNHRAVAELLALLNNAFFGAVYDPGNCLFDPEQEQPFPAGYEAVRPFLRHVHIKDAVCRNGEPVCLAPGQGSVGYISLLKRLKEDGYDGWLSLEPHYRKNAVLTEAQMRTPSGSAFSSGGKEAMQESAAALKHMLNQLNWIPMDNG